MATRFQGRTRNGIPPDREGEIQTGFGEWWAAIAVIALAAMTIVSLAGSAGPVARIAGAPDPSPLLLKSIGPAEEALSDVQEAFLTLCNEPVLIALELVPNCETGVITLPDSFFGGFGSSTLNPQYQEDVAGAVRTYLDRLRQLPALWDSLEAIELRGHSDPRAVRTPYTTNLIGSQQRPVGVLLFLMSPKGLRSKDKEDFQKLAVVSGVSFSRPPAECPENERRCYPTWRRVEIRPVLSEAKRRGDWSRTLEDVRVTARRIQQENQSQTDETKEP